MGGPSAVVSLEEDRNFSSACSFESMPCSSFLEGWLLGLLLLVVEKWRDCPEDEVTLCEARMESNG